MQDNSSSVIPSSNLSTPSLVNPLTSTHNDIHSDVKLSLEGNFSTQSNFEGSSIWAKKLTTSMLSHKAKFFSSIQLLDKEDQKALVFPFLNNYRSTVKSGAFGTASPIVTRKAKQLAHLFSNALDFSSYHLKIQDAQLDEQKVGTELTSNNGVLTNLQLSFPICLNAKSASLLVNLSTNLKRTYEKGPNFGPLERAHMEWMGDNEVTANRAAYIRFRKLSMYRNFVYQGSSAAMRYTLLNEFLMRKDLYPKKEIKSFIPKIPEVLNETFKDAVSTCENWYKQGQNLAMGLLQRQYKPEDKDSQKNETTISVPGLEGQTITIDWDKALHHALRSHAIAQVLGIPPQVLFLTGFAAIDIRQIVMSNDLDNLEKLIFVAQIVLKTLIKIIVVIGTQLFTSGILGLGGIDIISVPFGVHGERYLEKQLTSRVFGAIDKHFDSVKTTTDAIVDC